MKATYGTLAAIMAPLVVFGALASSGWISPAPATPGWHSTEYPPFFVFGALCPALSTVLILMLPFRRLIG